jgi:hypothetical protein
MLAFFWEKEVGKMEYPKDTRWFKDENTENDFVDAAQSAGWAGGIFFLIFVVATVIDLLR